MRSQCLSHSTTNGLVHTDAHSTHNLAGALITRSLRPADLFLVACNSVFLVVVVVDVAALVVVVVVVGAPVAFVFVFVLVLLQRRRRRRRRRCRS